MLKLSRPVPGQKAVTPDASNPPNKHDPLQQPRTNHRLRVIVRSLRSPRTTKTETSADDESGAAATQTKRQKLKRPLTSVRNDPPKLNRHNERHSNSVPHSSPQPKDEPVHGCNRNIEFGGEMSTFMRSIRRKLFEIVP